ncbi:shikimate dehydrogenase [Blastochloris viridis]|uniref:Shikimate dehydrogenase (NADP(+)) n=1 Tax=Blastochloris viridis TaxID=1079 RepID=A0A0H5BF55_BLAVI|nr:shikimate dehydrogenase [Blastochloris viridis]ALK11041.1 Shikimate dehydrogenase [Blastochloris viridis]BAR98971.1 shikimate 5-dehydrogenase I alpha [Blastochloris viridis]CUU43703.1 Shikimate dehydrogenase [Blastochloris viridis]
MTAPPRACIIGHPVAHSRSPLIHRHWLQHYRIAGEYCREEVTPAAFPAFLRDLARHGYVGANVTLPHKETALAVVDEADEAARTLGAVNTVWIERGRLFGANTDVTGFLADLDARLAGWDGRSEHAVVLGAGGAARAIVYGLLQRRIDRVSVINRSPERAEQLAVRFGPRVKPAGWAELPGLLASADLVVNTTSLGMAGQPPLVVDLAPLPPAAAVADIVYVPLETGLLAAARAGGHVGIDGLGMLLHQAAPGFTRWFGVEPTVTSELRAEIVADILAKTAAVAQEPAQ